VENAISLKNLNLLLIRNYDELKFTDEVGLNGIRFVIEAM